MMDMPTFDNVAVLMLYTPRLDVPYNCVSLDVILVNQCTVFALLWPRLLTCLPSIYLHVYTCLNVKMHVLMIDN
jgi:hypothetical protein